MGVHEFLTLILSRRLMFRQFRDLERSDKQEGMIPDEFWESWERARHQERPDGGLGKSRKEADARLFMLRCTQYISCWNAAEGENALMWMSYAPKGVAIKTTVGRLSEAGYENKEQFGMINCERVEYADDWHDLEDRGFEHGGVVQNRLFLNRKRKLFSAENEVRLRIQPRPTCQNDADIERRPPGFPELWPTWFPVVFENLEWVDEVVADSSIAAWSIATFSELIASSGLRLRLSGR